MQNDIATSRFFEHTQTAAAFIELAQDSHDAGDIEEAQANMGEAESACRRAQEAIDSREAE